MFVFNFTPVEREDYRVGVPVKKSYRLIFHSDDEKFGGNGGDKPLSYRAKKGECDGREYSIEYPLPTYGVAIFRFSY